MKYIQTHERYVEICGAILDIVDDLDQFTTSALARQLNVKRYIAGEIIKELVDSGDVLKGCGDKWLSLIISITQLKAAKYAG